MGDELDPRADIFSAGCVLYECLTGRLPHQADTLFALISKVLEETPVPPAEIQPDVPLALSALVMRTMARERDERPGSAAELYRLLEAMG